MSKNTAQVNVTIKSENLQVSTPGTGIAFVAGYTQKGPEANAEDLIASWNRFLEVFGDENASSSFATNVKQALAGGGKLRICRVLGVGALAGVGEEVADGTDDMFTLDAKQKGAFYNEIYTKIAAATDANANHFNIEVWGPKLGTGGTAVLLETFENLVAPTGGDAAPYTYLDAVLNGSIYIVPAYLDISASIVGIMNPTVGAYTITLGADGVQPTAAELGAGLIAFDDYVDGWLLACPGLTETTTAGLNAIMKAYVDVREDIVYLESISNEFLTAANIIGEIVTLANSSKFCGFIVGGAKEINYLGLAADMTGMGDVIGTILDSHNRNGVWVSPTAFANGKLTSAFGVVNNFGGPANLADRNLIANAGGNTIVLKSGSIMLWDFYSMEDASLAEKFLPIVLLETYIKRGIVPMLERYLNKPNTFSTWKAIWGSAVPFMDDLVAKDALFSYSWEGDQFASSLDTLQINNKQDVLAGKYLVVLNITTVAPMVEIQLDILINQDEGTVTVG